VDRHTRWIAGHADIPRLRPSLDFHGTEFA
jgi:hypothetical protein